MLTLPASVLRRRASCPASRPRWFSSSSRMRSPFLSGVSRHWGPPYWWSGIRLICASSSWRSRSLPTHQPRRGGPAGAWPASAKRRASSRAGVSRAGISELGFQISDGAWGGMPLRGGWGRRGAPGPYHRAHPPSPLPCAPGAWEGDYLLADYTQGGDPPR